MRRHLGFVLALVALAGCQRQKSEEPDAATPVAAPPVLVREVPDASLDASDDAQTNHDADSGSEVAWICVPPWRGSYPECSKGAMSSEEEMRSCLREHPYDPKYIPRFRIASGRWVNVSAKRWTCILISKTEKVRFTLDTRASWDVSVPPDCASGILDVAKPNFYGAFWTECSKRQRKDDVLVSE
ncbi:hypothetical protein LZC95_19085 [Pendulispora brunnea]|uniref:Uncharacterized protein n=1 Tax=Pendulispora brunnea TaxID=2905690 RepID=A0ABZ2KLG9_9BACT